MKLKKLNLKDAQLFYLMCLDNNKGVHLTEFSERGKELIKELSENGRCIFEKKRVKKRSYKVYLKNLHSLLSYLDTYYGITSLENYIKVMSVQNISRDEIASNGLPTKVKNSAKPKTGVHINAPTPIKIKINGEDTQIYFPIDTALFINKDAQIEIPEYITIVGVENFTNIIRATKQKKLFEQYGEVIFIELSEKLKGILKMCENKYIHYGDIDLAGVDIYQTQYYPIVKKRCDFFLPYDNIEEVFKRFKGIKLLYEQ